MMDVLDILSDYGAKFTVVPPKMKHSYRTGWQDNIVTIEEAKRAVTAGYNALVLHKHSPNIFCLDFDERFDTFREKLGDLQNTLTVYRNNAADRAKLYFVARDDRLFRRDFEGLQMFYLSRATNVAGIHPSGYPYRYKNVEYGLREIVYEELDEIIFKWTNGKKLADFAPKPVRGTSSQKIISIKDNPLARGYYNKAIDSEIKRFEEASDGFRNIALNLAAFMLGRLAKTCIDFPEDEAKRRLESAAIRRGLTPYETRKTIESGFKKGLRKGNKEVRPEMFLTTRDRIQVARAKLSRARGNTYAIRVADALLHFAYEANTLTRLSPSERALAKVAGISRLTIRKYLTTFVNQGILTKVDKSSEYGTNVYNLDLDKLLALNLYPIDIFLVCMDMVYACAKQDMPTLSIAFLTGAKYRVIDFQTGELIAELPLGPLAKDIITSLSQHGPLTSKQLAKMLHKRRGRIEERIEALTASELAYKNENGEISLNTDWQERLREIERFITTYTRVKTRNEVMTEEQLAYQPIRERRKLKNISKTPSNNTTISCVAPKAETKSGELSPAEKYAEEWELDF